MCRPQTMSVVCALLCLSAGALGGQHTVRGRVIDDHTGSAVGRATVTLRSAQGTALAQRESDSTGTFQLDFRVADAAVVSARVQVERLGYRTATTPLLDVDTLGTEILELRLVPEPLPVDSLRITGRAGSSPVLEGFFERRASGFGHYITRQDIERRRPMNVSDMLAAVPGVRLESSGSSRRRVATMVRAGGRCSADIFLDGMKVTRWAGPFGSVSVDDVASPPAVEGIEVYAGVANAPVEFRSASSDCGVIAIWTRRGDPAGPV